MTGRHKTYYQQHPWDICQPTTLTVGELLSQLSGLDPNLPVIIRSPEYGCFGSRVAYAIDGAQRETLDAIVTEHPAESWFDEEKGTEVHQDAYTERRPPWDGVVIS